MNNRSLSTQVITFFGQGYRHCSTAKIDKALHEWVQQKYPGSKDLQYQVEFSSETKDYVLLRKIYHCEIHIRTGRTLWHGKADSSTPEEAFQKSMNHLTYILSTLNTKQSVNHAEIDTKSA